MKYRDLIPLPSPCPAVAIHRLAFCDPVPVNVLFPVASTKALTEAPDATVSGARRLILYSCKGASSSRLASRQASTSNHITHHLTSSWRTPTKNTTKTRNVGSMSTLHRLNVNRTSVKKLDQIYYHRREKCQIMQLLYMK